MAKAQSLFTQEASDIVNGRLQKHTFARSDDNKDQSSADVNADADLILALTLGGPIRFLLSDNARKKSGSH